MSELYMRIEKLCASKSQNITAMCKESGASRASLTDLKMGRKQGLSSETLSKIANYFDVSVDFLLTGNTKEKAPAESGRRISDADLKFALWGNSDIDDSVLDDVKRFAKFAEENRKKNEK